uniref:RING finger protein n=1 Tax=Toxoplasma gondii COUG TaxID=1074873 RepID=A0A2G8Y798_TOXGO|nr:RING finger protein [Toxoplasma gondii COUG]
MESNSTLDASVPSSPLRSPVPPLHSRGCCDAAFFSAFFSTPAGTPFIGGPGVSSLPLQQLTSAQLKTSSGQSPALSPAVSSLVPNSPGVCTAPPSPTPALVASSLTASLLTRDVSFWCGNPAIERLSGTLRYFLTPSQATAERLLRNLPPPAAASPASGLQTAASSVFFPSGGEIGQAGRLIQPSPPDGSGSAGPAPFSQKQKCNACGCDVWQWLQEECVLVAPRVPSYISPAEFCDFLAPFSRRLLQAKVLHGPTTAEYLVLLHCNRLTAVDAIATFNGVPLVDGDSAVCELRIVKEVLFDVASPLSGKKVSPDTNNATFSCSPAEPPSCPPSGPPRLQQAERKKSGKPRGTLPEPTSTLALRSPRPQYAASGEDAREKRGASLHVSEPESCRRPIPGEGSRERSARRREPSRSVRTASEAATWDRAGSPDPDRDWSSFSFRSATTAPLHSPEWGEADDRVGDGLVGLGGELSVGESDQLRGQHVLTREPCGGLQFFLQRTQEDTQQEFCAVCLERVQIPTAPVAPALPASLGPPSNPIAFLQARETDDESQESQGGRLAAGASGCSPPLASNPAFTAPALCAAGGGAGGNAGNPLSVSTSDLPFSLGEGSLSSAVEKGVGGAQGGHAAPPGVAVTVLCGHSFHSSCLRKWSDPSCPVCRYQQHPYQPWCCFVCGSTEGVRACLLCGFIGCGDTLAPLGETASDASALAAPAQASSSSLAGTEQRANSEVQGDGRVEALAALADSCGGTQEGRESGEAGGELANRSMGRPVPRSRDADRTGKADPQAFVGDQQTASDGIEAQAERDDERGREESTNPEKKTCEERETHGGARGENSLSNEVGRKKETHTPDRHKEGCFTPGHSRLHFEETSHPHALELGTDCVWDFVSEGYVHLIVQKRCQAKAARLKKAEFGSTERCGALGNSECADLFVCPTCLEKTREGEQATQEGGDDKAGKETLAGLQDAQSASPEASEERQSNWCCLCGKGICGGSSDLSKPATGSPVLRDGETDDGCGAGGRTLPEEPASFDASSKRERGASEPSARDSPPCTNWKKVSGWVVEFNHMLAASLDSQRDYYEDRLQRMAQMYAQPLAECQASVLTAQQTVAELEAQVTKEETALAALEADTTALVQESGRLATQNAMLQQLHERLQQEASEARKKEEEEKKRLAERIQERLAEIEDLKQQIRDVSFHVQASASLSVVPEAKESYVLLGQREEVGSSRGTRGHSNREAGGPGGVTAGGGSGCRRGERRRGGCARR